ncbi:MAG: hypothetical protein ACQ5SW_04600 [Sphaerochaetaceae bacterium]
MKKGIYLLLITALLFLSSCTSIKRPEALPLTLAETPVEHLFKLSLNREMLSQAGYTLGDVVTIELEGMLIHARYNLRAEEGYSTLVANDTYALLYLPKELQEGSKGILFPYRDEQDDSRTSVNVSGSFIFTL